MLIRPVWIEIPVLDLERAMKFYGAVLDKELEVVIMNRTGITLVVGDTAQAQDSAHGRVRRTQ